MSSAIGHADPIEVVIRDAAHARTTKAKMVPDVTVDEVLMRAIGQWKLTSAFEYIVRVPRQGRQVTLTETLASLGIEPGDVLEVQTLAIAGGDPVGGATTRVTRSARGAA